MISRFLLLFLCLVLELDSDVFQICNNKENQQKPQNTTLYDLKATIKSIADLCRPRTKSVRYDVSARLEIFCKFLIL